MKSATNGVAGPSYSARGSSTCWTTPPSITAIRSDIVSASSWSCVTYTNVVPVRCWIRFSSSCISRRSFRSSAPSGSSSSRAAGRLTSARASATRWRWPPDSSAGLRSSYPSSRTTVSISATRSRISSEPIRFSFSPNATFSDTLM